MDKIITDLLLKTKEIETSYKSIEELLTYPEVAIDKTFYKYLLSKQNKIRKAYDLRCELLDENSTNKYDIYDALNKELLLLGDDGTPGAKIALQGDNLCINAILKSVYDISAKNAFLVDKLDSNHIIIHGIGAYSLFKDQTAIHKFKGNLQGEVKVFVTPYNEIESINEDDIEINLFHSDGAGGQNVNKVETAIRAIDKKSGIAVVCKDERSQLQNKNRAIENLTIKVNKYYQEKAIKEELDLIKKLSKNLNTITYQDGRKDL